MLATARSLYSSPAVPQPSINPSYRYLRTTVDGRVIFMVLGNVDQRPEGSVEVWYSSTGEVVRLLDGRLVSTTGLTTDWRQVRFPQQLPAWPAAESSNTPSPADAAVSFARERDLMPGYRMGVRDQVTRTAVAPPKTSALTGVDASSLHWYEERSTSYPVDAALPPARFAISQTAPGGRPQVVYSEQCISNDLCLSFEQWPPSSPATAGTTPPANPGT